MEAKFNLDEAAMNVHAVFSASIPMPDGATVLQIQAYKLFLSSVLVDPMEQVKKGFEDCFGEEFNDGTEEVPKPLENEEGETG